MHLSESETSTIYIVNTRIKLHYEYSFSNYLLDFGVNTHTWSPYFTTIINVRRQFEFCHVGVFYRIPYGLSVKHQ